MKTVITTIAIFFGHLATAQNVNHFVIDSGGATTSVTDIQIQFTIGEVNVQELILTDIVLSEEFYTENLLKASLYKDNENFLEQQIVVFPNPASEIVNIKSPIPISEVELFDALGTKVFATKESAQLNVSHLPSGRYLIRIISEKGMLYKKIVVK